MFQLQNTQDFILLSPLCEELFKAHKDDILCLLFSHVSQKIHLLTQCTPIEHSLGSVSCFKMWNISDKSHSLISKFLAMNSLISAGGVSSINGTRIYHMNLGQPLNFSNFKHCVSTHKLSFVNQIYC